ncbi:fungal-specific transcription factor domain-domain-containing protein [Naematelia encephala]|uniref:Fungal-specific transcription factor domain-domain-containing protein n=1 Tax=Naematelia encephala TaxID=71784 RepID=A0A1Y2AX09_9TREE|nr:fungal-specific transcription factor domain-domain-containing protein [Naematelia encephala]
MNSPIASSSRLVHDAHPGTANSSGLSAESPGRKRRKVTRSKSGCLTCRKRRKLCDMIKPACGACSRLKMDCSWPSDDGGRVSHHNRAFSTVRSSLVRPEPMSTAPLQKASTMRFSSRISDHSSQSFTPTPLMSIASTPHDFTGIIDHPLTLQPGLSTVSTYDTDSAPTTYLPLSAPMDDDLGVLDWFTGDGNLDDATLQLWAADCLAVPTTQTSSAFDSLNNLLLQPTPPSLSQTESTVTLGRGELAPTAPQMSRAPSGRSSTSPSRRRADTPTGGLQAALLSHFHDSLSRLVSCTGDAAPSAFEAFTKLSITTARRGPAGQGLHLSILAWAARHMVNRGLVKYEAKCEKFSSQAINLINTRMAELFDEEGVQRPANEPQGDADTEYMTLLAAALMIMQFKICRGDVWGFDTIVEHLTRLVPTVYRADGPDTQPDSMHYQFFENLLYHDVLGSFILTNAPMVPEVIVNQYCRTGLETLNTLTGASLPLFAKMHRIAALVHQRRSKRGKGWSDDDLLDVVQPAMELEEALTKEKKRLDELVITKPSISSHRYLHEAFRVACLLQLRCFVLGEPPCSLNIRLLVRQALSLLEAMCEQNLPGLCSAHWVIFITALCAVASGQEKRELDDRERIEQIYEDFVADFEFLNVSRSRTIVNEVWAKNSNGSVFVDWLDILAEFDWEIFVV